jgi:hypothetical protein
MNRRYKVRFHLGAGVNFGKWRVENVENKEVFFYSPDDYMISMINGKLYNQKGAATKIYNGQNKTVCAWIMCRNILVLQSSSKKYIKDEHDGAAKYNPRVNPYWTDSDGNDIDKEEFSHLITIGRDILTKKHNYETVDCG